MTDNQVLTIDGRQIIGGALDAGCCPPSLCNIDYCSFICSFLDYLPKGPLWDHWKRYRYKEMQDAPNGCVDVCSDAACLTIVDHTIYTARKLLWVLQNPLQTVLWESDPLTAFITRQRYLDNANWIDCFEGPSVGPTFAFPTPYQAVCNPLLPQIICELDTILNPMSPSVDGNPNPIIDIEELVKAACPVPLTLAVQYGILVAHERMKLGVVRNQDGINFVLAALGAQITVAIIDPMNGCAPDGSQMSGTTELCVMVDDCAQMTGNTACQPYRPCMSVTLSNVGTTIPGGAGITVPYTCENAREAKTPVTAWYHFAGIEMPKTPGCIGGVADIWPAMMAAECILVSLLPVNMRYTLSRSFVI